MECKWERELYNPDDWLQLDSPQLYETNVAKLHNMAGETPPTVNSFCVKTIGHLFELNPDSGKCSHCTPDASPYQEIWSLVLG